MPILERLFKTVLKVLGKLIRRNLIHDNLNIFYRFEFFHQRALLLEQIEQGTHTLKTTSDSQHIYDAYDDRELENWLHEERFSVFNGKVQKQASYWIRECYIEYLMNELPPINQGLSVLEVGCGNCINLVRLRNQLPKNAFLSGIDVSSSRLEVARDFFGDQLETIELHTSSITENTGWQDESFDVVFTMHCLEQIPYQTYGALKEIHRLARQKIILIEPVYELANPTQKLKLLRNDHCRILYRAIRDLGYKIERMEALSVQMKPTNQSSIIVIQV